MKAVKITQRGQAGVVTDAPIPKLPSPEWLLVKVAAVALNPSDWKHVEYLNVKLVDAPPTVGFDFSGVVEEAGSGVTRPFKKGDRVCGCVFGSNFLNPANGAFAEYLAVKEGLAMHVPDALSFEEAAGLGCATLTVGQGLYQQMQLPMPDALLDSKKAILIYGGSSGMGAVGIQFAKLSGFEVWTTCSPTNFAYVKRLGADHVFDAYDPEVGTKIREATQNTLYYAWDCISEKGSTEQCYSALASSAPPGQEIRYGSLLPIGASSRNDVTATVSIGMTGSGDEWGNAFGDEIVKMPGQADHYEFMVKWQLLAERLLAEGKWKAHRQEVRGGGLEGVVEGIRHYKEGKVSGAKLVYRVGDL